MKRAYADEQVFKIKTGQLLRKFDSAHSQGITSLSFSRDGTHILSASYDGLARVHGLKSGKLLKEFRGHTSYVNHATYSPDGTQVTITSATDGYVTMAGSLHYATACTLCWCPPNLQVPNLLSSALRRLWTSSPRSN